MRQLDKNTFGDSKAEIALAEELSVAQDKATRRKIGRILFGQHKLLESIEIKNSRQSEVIYKFFREYINKQVADEEIERHPKVKMYFKNVLVARLREKFGIKKP